MKPSRADSKEPRYAFTRVELLVIVATLALLAAVTRPVWAGGGPIKGLACMENLRRLSAAWLLFADDNGGKFVGNYHGGFVPNVGGKERPWATGWLSWETSSDNTNTIYLTNPRYAALAPYLVGSSSVFKCPADDYLSRAQQARGWPGRVRSYSMSCAIGEGNATTGPVSSSLQYLLRNSDFGRLPPQRTFVFLEEHPDSINDPLFFVPNSSRNMPDLPASHHDGAAWFTFADGHVEPHRWQSAEVTRPVTALANINNLPVPADNPDLRWLLDHTPQR